MGIKRELREIRRPARGCDRGRKLQIGHWLGPPNWEGAASRKILESEDLPVWSEPGTCGRVLWEDELRDKKGKSLKSIFVGFQGFFILEGMKKFFIGLNLWMLMGLLAIPATALEIKDIAGNVLEVPPYPHRIVSLAPSITECLFAIGCGKKVVGVTLFSNYPPEVKKLPRVGSYIQPNIERILALRPDVCIATKDGNPKTLVLKLKEVGVGTFVVDPRDIRSLFHTMLLLGELTGCYCSAQKVVGKLNREVKKIEEKARSFFPRPKVFFQIGIDPMVTVGSHTLIDNLISLAGGVNIFRGRLSYPRVSVEQVIAKQPDIIVITSMVNSRPNLERLRGFWFHYREIPAVKRGNVFVVNSDYFNRPSPRAIEGLKILSKLFEKVVVIK